MSIRINNYEIEIDGTAIAGFICSVLLACREPGFFSIECSGLWLIIVIGSMTLSKTYEV